MGRKQGSRVLVVLEQRRKENDQPRRPGDWKLTRHHMIPRSRGGETTNGNLLQVPRRIHEAFHRVFSNLTPEEAIVYLAAYWAPAGYFSQVILEHGGRKLVLAEKDLTSFLDQALTRSNFPSFHSNDERFIRPVYRNRRKRRARVKPAA